LRTGFAFFYNGMKFNDLWDGNGSDGLCENGTHVALLSGVFGKVQSLREIA